ncbi:hypothetical protein OAU50_03425 [Planctomycetota bacterium]|nr:hypothetical protein [Planctomycetota bacterium]
MKFLLFVAVGIVFAGCNESANSSNNRVLIQAARPQPPVQAEVVADYDDLLELAVISYLDGEYEVCQEHLRNALELNRDGSYALQLQAQLYGRLDKNDLAHQCIDRIDKIEPKPTGDRLRAIQYFSQWELDKALSHAITAVEHDDCTYKEFLLLAMIHHYRGDHELALSDLAESSGHWIDSAFFSKIHLSASIRVFQVHATTASKSDVQYKTQYDKTRDQFRYALDAVRRSRDDMEYLSRQRSAATLSLERTRLLMLREYFQKMYEYNTTTTPSILDNLGVKMEYAIDNESYLHLGKAFYHSARTVFGNSEVNHKHEALRNLELYVNSATSKDDRKWLEHEVLFDPIRKSPEFIKLMDSK